MKNFYLNRFASIRKALIFAFIGLILSLHCNPVSAQVLEQDSLALVAFYNSTGGPNWNNNSNWLTGTVDSWYGVTVEGERVSQIILNSNNLIGILPSELGLLDNLETIACSNDNGLTGEIPVELFQITSLKQIGIGNCSLTGTISSSIGNCSFLTELHLPQNNLTGPIPPEIGNLNSLQFLDLHDNQLTGSLPPELGNLSNLEELRLNNNQLSGNIPPEFSGLTNISIIYLHDNNLLGSLHESLINLFVNSNNPLFLNISNNNFSGKIPESWGTASFNIGEFVITGNNFTYLPPVNYNWLITYFRIDDNKFTFEHIESHYQSYSAGLYYFFYYSPQDDMLEEIDTVLVPGSNFSIYSGTGGEFTNYKWYKNDELIIESTEADSLHLTGVTLSDTGEYYCQAGNSLANQLTLYRNPVHITLDTSTNITNCHAQKYISVFPNPASNKISIDFPFETGSIYIRILDIHSKCIFRKEMNQIARVPIIIDLTGIKQGLYMLNVKTENENFTTKFIKNKRGINR